MKQFKDIQAHWPPFPIWYNLATHKPYIHQPNFRLYPLIHQTQRGHCPVQWKLFLSILDFDQLINSWGRNNMDCLNLYMINQYSLQYFLLTQDVQLEWINNWSSIGAENMETEILQQTLGTSDSCQERLASFSTSHTGSNTCWKGAGCWYG